MDGLKSERPIAVSGFRCSFCIPLKSFFLTGLLVPFPRMTETGKTVQSRCYARWFQDS